MKNHKISCAKKIVLAAGTPNSEAYTRRIIGECVRAMIADCTQVATRYGFEDLPFVIAAMRITEKALSSMLDENGRGITDFVQRHTECTLVDVAELKKQLEENDVLE